MNERIRELAIKAYNNAGQPTPEVLSSFMEVYSEKFAELIVKECMKLNRTVFDGENFTADYLDGLYKKHFGVKE